ncbi:hypothetical protein EN739_09465 [Mesorhizobium sp. M2A.F.Ca.ET.017.03.2.1]|uniref:hypothetical protein n=1 Tax=Mesorhizobium sp. TaxID=1871066 RepID=UPI000FD2FF4F|nr:hypothetical protein [Mesorhizobium sp.]RVC96304.1 hypothetical protein EN739_09465 [Mesorhizobium sp. M2A.F.Ca.ET.017.03.2.1]
MQFKAKAVSGIECSRLNMMTNAKGSHWLPLSAQQPAGKSQVFSLARWAWPECRRDLTRLKRQFGSG